MFAGRCDAQEEAAATVTSRYRKEVRVQAVTQRAEAVCGYGRSYRGPCPEDRVEGGMEAKRFHSC